MTVETPDHFGGKPIPEDAIEIALAAEKKDGNEWEAPSLDDFIYVPSVNLYVAKERALLNHNWYETHKKLDEQNLRMPTIPQFIEFLKHLRANPTTENTSIYDEITEKRVPWRAEWLDAKFYNAALWVAYNHIVDSDGKLVAQDHEKLEGHLIQDKKIPEISLEYWLNNPTKQGLPPIVAKHGDLWYRLPIAGAVAKFYIGYGAAGLACNSTPDSSGSGLGVRAVRTRTQNLGGKQ